ncbi:hypothetical protein [Adhaeribacter rhizoryzae]|uniref:Uncharacterized protein n=1 Tax=Adhaeribacter rhizoryzae TaxID=2607907 RepID=A0A5M6DRP7_9BACT|nr:hypothetical protein [Adhaeribacter rhizoryzae]KAA5548860.1 hypothetical protein F0145_04935 [Adhaeribacter rhizoryzae]
MALFLFLIAAIVSFYWIFKVTERNDNRKKSKHDDFRKRTLKVEYDYYMRLSDIAKKYRILDKDYRKYSDIQLREMHSSLPDTEFFTSSHNLYHEYFSLHCKIIILLREENLTLENGLYYSDIELTYDYKIKYKKVVSELFKIINEKRIEYDLYGFEVSPVIDSLPKSY